MLDITLIRQNPKLVEENLAKRHDSEKIVWLKDLVEKDLQWRSLKQEVDALRQARNKLSIAAGRPSSEAIKAARQIASKVKEKEAKMGKLKIGRAHV